MSINNENYGARKCFAASVAIISLIATGTIVPGVCAFFIEEAITEARKQRKMAGERLAR